ncbi:MAG TPA: PAS domain-containing sensor histidine kinase [Chloroflexota bacterium]|nr:PAS domain-containing sensor histidine kinase [Chloroflexota bacterium]
MLDPVWRPRPDEAGDFVIITHGRDTPFLDVDDAACRILGYPRESLLQRSMRDIFPMRPGSEHVDTLAAVRDQLLRGLPVTYDSTVRRRDGGLLPIRMTIQRVPGLEPPVYRTIFADLSHERDAQARTLEVEKQRVLQEVGSAIAHELNTPLAVILGNIEIAREEFPDAALQDLLRPVQEAAERIAGTVKRLQQFAKLIVPSGWASVDLSQLVSQVIEQTRPIWEAGPQATGQTIALELHVVPVPLVRAHSIELQDAVRELISNAVLAQPEGGTITISTGADDRWVWVSVRDTGVGMTDEVRQRCIDPFFTTRRPAAMGLGLNRVYHTVLQHRGRLQIESHPGAGTCVTISLPVVPEASTAAVVRGGEEAHPT